MLNRIKNKINREIRKMYRKGVPCQQQVTFNNQDSSWYEPLLAGPSTFAKDCCSSQTVSSVMNIIRKLTPDDFIRFNLQYYTEGIKRFGNNWQYADILTVLYGICSNIKVNSYMEIGVRRGRSMAVVAAACPTVSMVGFDIWRPNYVGIDNPGPDFVQKEIEKVGYDKKIEFVSGNSQYTVPEYFKNNPGTYFDLITVDGEHTVKGAKRDLVNVIPYLKIGGFLVFDDICSPDLSYLRSVWQKTIVKSDRFACYSFEELGYGIAFAIKKY